MAFYDRTMQSLARRADSIDDYWNRFRTTCRPPGPFTSGGREWFSVWDRPPAIDLRDGQCVQWVGELTQLANGVRVSMSAADETARAASVYPASDAISAGSIGWIGMGGSDESPVAIPIYLITDH